MLTKAVRQYLERHAEPEAANVPWKGAPVKHLVCIPACREDGSLIQTLESLSGVLEAEQALVVVVVNGGVLADQAVHQSNALCWQELEQRAQIGSGPMAWGSMGRLRILAVDRFSEGRRLPAKQGVGLARKIAGDIGLRLVSDGHVQSEWIRCTDADVEVPKDYFLQTDDGSDRASAVL